MGFKFFGDYPWCHGSDTFKGVFCFLAGAVSSTGSGNGPSDPKTMVWGVEVDPVFWELPREVMLRQLAGSLKVPLLCFS